MDFSKISNPQKVNLLISFIDITSTSQKLADSILLFELINSFAHAIIETMHNTSGRIIKFVGDTCLIIFPEDSVDEGVLTIKSIKERCDKLFIQKGIPAKLSINIHFGEVAIGQIGYGEYQSIDIFGDAVSITSKLPRGEHSGKLIISPQTFRKLSPTTRKYFHKYTPPILYIAED